MNIEEKHCESVLSEEIVYLNVGGHQYVTTMDTITNRAAEESHYFITMFQNMKHIPLLRDKQGYIFIDRDGRHFKYLLNYLRAGGDLEKCVFPWNDDIAMSELEIEAQFYGFSHLVDFFRTGDLCLLTEGKQFDEKTCSTKVKLYNDNKTVEKQSTTWKTVVSLHPLFTLPQSCFQGSNIIQLHSYKRTNTMINSHNAKLFNYYEVLIESIGLRSIYMGILDSEAIREYQDKNSSLGADSSSYAFCFTGLKRHMFKSEAYGESCSAGDRIGMWFNTPERSLYFYKNGISMGVCFKDLPLTRRITTPTQPSESESSTSSAAVGSGSSSDTLQMDVPLRYNFAISLLEEGNKVTIVPYAQHPEL